MNGSIPIQTSPNCPFPRRLFSCSDSRGISHTSLVLIDRSARRGIPLWQGTTKQQQSPAARSVDATERGTNKSTEMEKHDCRQRSKLQIWFEKRLDHYNVYSCNINSPLLTGFPLVFTSKRSLLVIPPEICHQSTATKRMWLLAVIRAK